MYVHWIRLYISFHLGWVLAPFIHSRLPNLQASEGTFAHVITPLIRRLVNIQKLDKEVFMLKSENISSTYWVNRPVTSTVYR